MSFENHTVMITGAAGHLGRAVAAAFANAGARLLLLDRQTDALQAAFGTDGTHALVVADLLDHGQVRAALATGIERFGVEVFTQMREGLKDCDIVMMLRLQRERMHGSFVPSVKEYFRYYGLDADKLSLAKRDALVMHPGPMNRGVEISSEIADGAQSLIREQVEMGVAVRMAVLEALATHLPNG